MSVKNSEENVWDKLANRFNTYKKDEDIHPDAAVNIYVGWPVINQQIETFARQNDKESLNILDFGCGAGRLCKELASKGHNVTGYDPSEKLLTLAKKRNGNGVELLDNFEFKQKLGSGSLDEKFDVITSIHVFDWIEEIESTLKELSNLLVKGGTIIFAVFPKIHVKDSIIIGDLFEEYNEQTQTCTANFDGVRITTYVRDTTDYDEYFEQMGFEKVFESMPDYPDEFLKKYEWTGSLEPEMLILQYTKL